MPSKLPTTYSKIYAYFMVEADPSLYHGCINSHMKTQGKHFPRFGVWEPRSHFFSAFFIPDIFLSCKFASLYVKVFNEWIHTLKPRFLLAPCRIQSLSLMTLIPGVYDFLTENFSLCILLHSTKIISVLPPNSPHSGSQDRSKMKPDSSPNITWVAPSLVLRICSSLKTHEAGRYILSFSQHYRLSTSHDNGPWNFCDG